MSQGATNRSHVKARVPQHVTLKWGVSWPGSDGSSDRLFGDAGFHFAAGSLSVKLSAFGSGLASIDFS